MGIHLKGEEIRKVLRDGPFAHEILSRLTGDVRVVQRVAEQMRRELDYQIRRKGHVYSWAQGDTVRPVIEKLLEERFLPHPAPRPRPYPARHPGAGSKAALRKMTVELRATKRKLAEVRHYLLESEQLALVGELAAKVIHEMNHPLSAIVGLSQLLLEGGAGNGTAVKDLKTIESEAKRAQAIARQFQRFARPHPLHLAVTHLPDLLDETLNALKPVLKDKKITLVKKVDPDLPDIRADAEQLKQVFLNLFSNAIEAMGSRGSLTITGRPLPSGASPGKPAHVEIQVADTGQGIPARIRDLIFKPFFTTKPDGSGLGLAVTQTIVEKHGGTITFRRCRPRGTNFIVTLPLKPPAQHASSPAAPSRV